MRKISELNTKNIEHLKYDIKQMQNQKPTKIPFNDEKLAFYISGLFKPQNIYDCFVIFASGTLCNAFVKKEYAPKEVKHSYAFKGFLDAQVDRLLKEPIEDIKIYHSPEFSVVDICGLKFSYHGLGDKNNMANSTKNQANKIWEEDSLRLTACAKELFDNAKKFIDDGKVSEKNKKIYQIISTKLVNSSLQESRNIVKDILEEKEI
ncbi:MAG: hypothetical protein J6T39_01150 [Clostridia bacterium]|nr:hypothetical protein [Clostridia bacterium]